MDPNKSIWFHLRHDPRNPGQKEFYFLKIRFKSYGRKSKTWRYSATVRPTDLILFELIVDMYMNLSTKCGNFRSYGS